MLKHRIVMAVGAGLAIALILFSAPWWAWAVLLACWLALVVAGSFRLQWQYHLPVLFRSAEERDGRVAITFDDGPHPEVTPRVLQLLADHGAKATFFCIGKQVAAYPDLVRDIIAQGHTIANHSYSHDLTFGFKSTAAVVKELEMTEQIVQEITGLRMRLFRPPFGVTNPQIARAVAAREMVCAGWSIRSLDTTRRSAEHVWKRVERGLKEGEVLLLHDTGTKCVEVLERSLELLRTQGLSAVTVDRLLNIEPYRE